MLYKKMMIGALMSLALVSCDFKKKGAEEGEEKATYLVTNAAVRDTSYVKDYVSQIQSVKDIEIRAQEKGFLQKIFVDEGQFVKEGQLLFKIMPKMYEAELMKSEAEAKTAEIEYLNTKSLADKNVVSRTEQAMAKAKWDQAKAQVATSRLHLSFTEIRAPFAGNIGRIPKKIGSLIDEGELLTTLSDNSSVYVYYNVSEPEYLDYKNRWSKENSAQVQLLLANNKLFDQNGLVEVIESEFDNETGTIAFRAKFPNANRLLKNGETGKIHMTVPLKNALIIPQKATYEIQDRKYVFVVGKDNKVKSVEIKTLLELPDLYVIRDGITVNDKILLEGIQKVKENEKIEYKFITPSKALSSLRLKAE